MGDTSRWGKNCGGDVGRAEYPVGAKGRFGGGGDILAADIAGEGWAEDVSGADSTYDWWSGPFMRWTSRSLGSRAEGEAAGGSCTGLERLGSSPALMAFAMRRAWYFANFDFAVTSCSRAPQILSMSRKVAAARNVSAV